jgi:hypothetical protein
MGKIKRNQVKHFLNTGTLLSPVWSLIGDGVSAAQIAMNPNVVTENYIHEANASVSIDSYAPTLPIEAVAINGDAVFEFLDNLRKNRAVLDSAETEVVNVWIYETPALTYYYAEKQPCSIQFDSFGGDGGASAKLNYTINFVGNPVLGSFSPTDLAFVAAPINTILTTMVIGSVTLAPLFATDKSWLHYAGSVSNATTGVTMTSTLTGATILQKDDAGSTVTQAGTAALDVGVNHLTIDVTVGTETVTYHIDITRAAS